MTRKSTKRISVFFACSGALVLGLGAGAANAQQGAEREPAVGVQQAEPEVNVQTAEPNVRVIPPSSEPNVQGDENVNVRVLPPEGQGAQIERGSGSAQQAGQASQSNPGSAAPGNTGQSQ